MNRSITIVVIGALVVMGVVFGAGPIRRRFNELRSDQALIRGDTGDVMASASYQRFAARRAAIADMRAALLSLTVAESLFVADSGYPTVFSLSGRYAVASEKTNIGPTITLERDRWVAKIGNVHTSMECTITALLDTASGRYHAGEPVCAGWTAAESLAAAAPAPVPAAPPTAGTQPPAPDRPQPRRHRDWGPRNNTPPPQPLVRKNTGPSEYSHFGRWMARKAVPAFREKRADGSPVFVFERCEEFTVATGDVHVERPGIVVFRHATVNPPTQEGPEVDSIAFTPRDTLFLLHHIGEGYVLWWFRGQIDTGYWFWEEDDDPDFVPNPSDTVALVQKPVVTWWVRARNRAGREGWVLYDYASMATGGYMDEIEPCTPTEKR